MARKDIVFAALRPMRCRRIRLWPMRFVLDASESARENRTGVLRKLSVIFGRGAVEVARKENRLEQRREFAIVCTQHGPQAPFGLRRDLIAHEEAVDAPRDVSGRRGLLEEQVDQPHAVEPAIPAEDGLHAAVVLVGVDGEARASSDSAGERPRGFANLELAAAAHAHREHLDGLAREFLVWRTLDIHAGVEKGQRRRVLRHADQQLAKVA